LTIYEFHFYAGEDRRPLLDFFEAADDAAALNTARLRLDEHLSCEGVEVFEGGRLVGKVERSVRQRT